MTDARTQRLVHSRHYSTDRLVEVKEELARLQTEGVVLKTKLETIADEIEAGQIRRRRRFLSRRLDELKAERAALTTELQAATVQLNEITGKASNAWHESAIEPAGSATMFADQGNKPARPAHGRD